MDGVPALSYTQETLDTISRDTVSSIGHNILYPRPTPLQEFSNYSQRTSHSNESKRKRAEQLRKKKSLFYNIYGPRILFDLKQRLQRK